MKTIITIPCSSDRRKKSWRKTLASVNKELTNGYAFVGEWLRAGEKAELEIGTHVLTYDEPGSMKNWYPEVCLYKTTETGLELIYKYEGKTNERAWALGCRDKIASLIAPKTNKIDELKLQREKLLENLHQIDLEIDKLITVGEKNANQDQI